MDDKKDTFMNRLAAFIVDRRILIFVITGVLCVFCAIASRWVVTNDLLTDYLSDDTETRQGLDIMEREFITYGTARVMVENITFEQALGIQERIEAIENVKSVDFRDKAENYANTAALFEVTFAAEENDDISIAGLDAVKELLYGYDSYIASNIGNPLKAIINKEMLIVDGISVLIIVFVMLFTSKTFAEIPIMLISFGVAALLNMGTNFFFSPISFVTDSIAIVLQLALAIDYSIILVHRYLEERVALSPRDACVAALSKAIPEISGSSLTTVGGLLALCFMHYRLGLDLGVVLVKAIVLSLASVFFILPGLLVTFSGWIDRSHHRNILPDVSFLGRFAYKMRYVIPPFFLVLLVSAAIFSGNAHYVYDYRSVDSIRHNQQQLDERRINESFPTTNRIVIIVPSGDFKSEAAIVAELEELPRIVKVTALANTEADDGYMITDSVTPRQFSELAGIEFEAAQVLFSGYAMQQEDYGRMTDIASYSIPLIDIFTYVNEKRADMNINMKQSTVDSLDDLQKDLDDARAQLMSSSYSRIVVDLNTKIEDKESFDYLNILHGCAAKYYEEYYVIGDTTSCKDLDESFVGDNKLITALSIIFVVAVLIFTFKSAGLPVLLIVIIQGSIWINFSTPFILGKDLYFLTYLIISAIQMGANIDYAIVISSRYLELKEGQEPKAAMIATMNAAFPTIITSGVIMACAGIAIGFVASNETISAIGIFLGTGTTISIILVLFFLPAILLLGDTILQKTKLNINLQPAHHSGRVRIDGHVRGRIEGFVDGEFHGYVIGEVSATVGIGGKLEESPVDGK